MPPQRKRCVGGATPHWGPGMLTPLLGAPTPIGDPTRPNGSRPTARGP